MEQLCQNPFFDGNNRVALVAIGIFLEENGLRQQAGSAEAYDFMMAIARGEASQADIVDWLVAHTAM